MKQLTIAKQAAESRLVQELQSISSERDPQKLGSIHVSAYNYLSK